MVLLRRQEGVPNIAAGSWRKGALKSVRANRQSVEINKLRIARLDPGEGGTMRGEARVRARRPVAIRMARQPGSA